MTNNEATRCTGLDSCTCGAPGCASDHLSVAPEAPVVTAETITDDQIEQLRAEAHRAGDRDQVALCRTALLDDFRACDEDRTAIAFARAKCADVINTARAQEEV